MIKLWGFDICQKWLFLSTWLYDSSKCMYYKDAASFPIPPTISYYSTTFPSTYVISQKKKKVFVILLQARISRQQNFGFYTPAYLYAEGYIVFIFPLVCLYLQ